MKIKLTLPFETLRRFGVPDALVDLAAQVTETVSMGVIQATEDADTSWEPPVPPPPPRRAAAPTPADAAAYTAAAPAAKPAAKEADAKKAAAKKPDAKKAETKKAEAKAPAKKAEAKKSSAKKSAEKKASTKKATAKKDGKKSSGKKAEGKKAKPITDVPGKKTEAIAASDNPWENFYNALPESSQKFLDLLKARGTISIDEAVEELGLKSTRAMGGITGAMSRWAPKSGVEVPFSTGTNADGRRTYTWVHD